MNVERLSESGNRIYRSPTRRARAEETKRQIADAAQRLFIERGWSGTRVKDVAAAAGVAEPTVYAVYGNKSGLAAALLDSLEAQADLATHLRRIRDADGDPRTQLAHLAAFERSLFQHGADAIVVLREAGRSTPDLAHLVDEGRARGDRARRHLFGGWPEGALRPGLTVEEACDVSAALFNVDVYLVLTRERGWAPERVESWWSGTLAGLLLAEPGD